MDSPLTTSPADILRELGVATTFVHQSRFLPVAQLWAHVRYCATMRATSRGLLALSPDAAKLVVHHHKVAQSEQLGIGLALVVARAVLRERHPNLDYHVVDADVARAGLGQQGLRVAWLFGDEVPDLGQERVRGRNAANGLDEAAGDAAPVVDLEPLLEGQIGEDGAAQDVVQGALAGDGFGGRLESSSKTSSTISGCCDVVMTSLLLLSVDEIHAWVSAAGVVISVVPSGRVEWRAGRR